MALINLRNALMTGKRLPYDAEVEFLESTGTQYINTNIKPGPNTRAEIVFAMTTFTANCGLFGARGQAVSNNLAYNLFIVNYGGHNQVRWDWSGNGVYKTTQAETSTVATYSLGVAGSTITRDGAFILDVSAGKVAIDYPIYIFNFNNVGTPFSTGANARFWSVKIYDGQTLVFDGIPVRKGTVGYLYDRVSGRLFGNAGTGDFVLGQDVVPVEYLASTGTQRILTDIYTDANTAINCKASGTSGSFFGVLPSSNTAWWTILPNDFGKLRYYYGGSGATDVATIDATVPHDYQCSNKVLVDGVEAISLSRTLGSATVPLSLFARTASSGTSFTSLLVGRMWYLQIIQSGATVRSFRSVRVGTEGAMMDVLTRRIYRNAGTGAFGYGNDLKYPIPSE